MCTKFMDEIDSLSFSPYQKSIKRVKMKCKVESFIQNVIKVVSNILFNLENALANNDPT